MATTKPRITITLTKQQYDVLRAVSDYGGQSMSNFVSGLIEQSLPVLERMAETARKIKLVQDERRQQIYNELSKAQDLFEPAFNGLLGQADLLEVRSTDEVKDAGASPAPKKTVKRTPKETTARTTRKAAAPKTGGRVKKEKKVGEAGG